MWSRRELLALVLCVAACAAPSAPATEPRALAFGLVVDDAAAPAREWPHWDGGGRWSVPEGFAWRLEQPLLECRVLAARAALDARGAPCVQVRLAPEDAARLGALSARGVGRRMAVLVDGRVVCAPRLGEPLSAERLELSANFSQTDVDALLVLLR